VRRLEASVGRVAGVRRTAQLEGRVERAELRKRKEKNRKQVCANRKYQVRARYQVRADPWLDIDKDRPSGAWQESGARPN